jgi:hypothetical protein
MDQTVLVNDDKRAGLALVKALESAGMPVTAAFWYELPETGRWRLFIVSPWVENRGLSEIYQRVNDAIQSQAMGLIRSDDVTAIGEDHSIYRRLVATFAARTDGVHIDLPDSDWGGVDFGDAFIYRLSIPARAAHPARNR